MSFTIQNLRKLVHKCNITKAHIPKLQISRQYCYKASPFVTDLEERNVKYEVTKNPDEWKYIERILPQSTVPLPSQRTEYLSEWRPQSEECLKYPYFIQRNKNHMIPVYMKLSHRNTRRLTYIRKVQGDIWQLDEDIKKFLQKESKTPIETRVNEFVGNICVHGDHVNAIKYWLQQRNF